MADGYVTIGGQKLKLIDNGDGTYRLGADINVTSITATAMDVTIRDATQESQKLAVDSDGAASVKLTGSFLTMRAPVTGIKTVTATAAEVFAGASRLTGRRRMVLKNEDTVLRFRIGSSSVTQANGFPVEPLTVLVLDFDPSVSVPVYAISEGGNLNVAVMEI